VLNGDAADLSRPEARPRTAVGCYREGRGARQLHFEGARRLAARVSERECLRGGRVRIDRSVVVRGGIEGDRGSAGRLPDGGGEERKRSHEEQEQTFQKKILPQMRRPEASGPERTPYGPARLRLYLNGE